MPIRLILASTALACTLIACDNKASPAPTPVPPVALDTSHAKRVSTRVPEGQTFKGLIRSNSLPFAIQLGKHGALKIEDEGKSNIIFDGEATLAPDAKLVGGEKSLRIRNFATTIDTVLIQVDASQGSDTTLVGGGGAAPILVDTKKDEYFPVGFIYEDESRIKIRFTPGDPIQDFSALPALSRSRPAQKLTLLYRVTVTRDVKYFALSNEAIVEFDPSFPVSPGGR
jgi:hypothetical protein